MNFKQLIKSVHIFSMSIVLLIYTYCTTVYASETDTEQEWQAEEVEAFVRAFYEAHTEKDFERVQEQMVEDEFTLYAIHNHALFEFGLQKYDNITVKAYSMKDKNHWLAVVEYEALFEGINIGIPGSVTVLVQRQEDDQWKILTDCPEDLYEEVCQIMETEEIVEWFNEVNVKYNEIMSDNPEFTSYFVEMTNSVAKAVLEAMENENAIENEDAIENKDAMENKDAGNTSTEENNSELTDNGISDIYIVQKGDCLWRIAQNQLGDGRRWNELYRGNKEIIGDNPNLILVGMQLRIK